jgi:hypothetical protein
MLSRKRHYLLVGAAAGAAIGVVQMPANLHPGDAGYFYQLIGYIGGFALFGLFIGWLSGRKKG